MQKFYTTKEAAAILGVRIDKLQREVWLGNISQPCKISNRFLWTGRDIERAAGVLKCRIRRDFMKGDKNG